ncbi:MAG: PAS domain-containing protein [Legionellales bacterium]|jgi:PAS domain S-box-containing protein
MNPSQEARLEFLERLVAELPECIYWKDTQGRYLGCNNNLVKLSGFSTMQELIGKTDREMAWNALAADIEQNDAQVMASGKEHLFHEAGTYKDGSYHVMLSRKAPFKNVQGDVIGLLAISTDIPAHMLNNSSQTDENKKLIAEIYTQVTGQEQSAQISILEYVENIRNYLEKIISLMPGNVYWKTKEGMFLGCNDNQADVFNLSSRHNILGKNDRDFVPNDLIAQVLKHDRKVIESNKEMLFEEIGTDSQGGRAIYLSHKVPLHDQKNNLIGVLGVSLDITQQKNIEDELRKARDAAQIANAAKSDFIRNMSHDIRTPLTGIIGMADMIGHETVNEDAQDIRQAGQALLNLLNEIIETVQLESGDIKHQKECFNIKNTIDALIIMFKPAIKHKGLKLEVYYDDNIPEVLYGQELLIHRIILNLLGNALKFTDKGSISHEVSLAKKDADKVSLKIVIRDTGIGIPKDKQEMIFDKFSRLSPSYSNHYKGTGLGLYNVKEFIKKLGGDIKVNSNAGEGAQFTCTVQFKLPTSAQLKKYQKFKPNTQAFSALLEHEIYETKKSDVPETNKQAVGERFRILLVEDSLLPKKIAVNLLIGKGYNVTIAENAAQAIEKLNAFVFDMIYMDIGLPDGTGIEVTKKIRNNPKNPNTNTFIVALTAHCDERITNECLAAGIQKVFDKPLNKDKIEAAELLMQQRSSLKNEEPLIDLQQSTQLMGGDFELAKEMLSKFIHELPVFQEEITKAYENKNWETLRYHVHKLHGGLCYCGIPRLKLLTSSFEKQLIKQEGNYEENYQILVDEIQLIISKYNNHNSQYLTKI